MNPEFIVNPNYNGRDLTKLLISFFTVYNDLHSLIQAGVIFQILAASLTNVDSINFVFPIIFRFFESVDLNVHAVD